MLQFVVDNYQKLFEQTIDFPEWHNKVKMEIGVVVSQIISIQVGDQKLNTILADVDQQAIFR